MERIVGFRRGWVIWGGELGGLLSMKKKGGCWCWVVGIIGKVRVYLFGFCWVGWCWKY